jgi:6-phosphogluconolactonase
MTRSIVLLTTAVVTAGLLGAANGADAPKGDKFWLYIGTYTGAKSKGIYRCEFDAATGKLSAPELAAEVRNPTFLAIHPSNRFLYAVGEHANFEGKKGTGAVHAYSLEAKTGALTPLNTQSSGGDGPCHLVVDRSGKNVLVANYGGGSVEVLPLGVDGKLAEATSFIQHTGTVADSKRQGKPHAHSINVDAGNRYAVAADLGLDKLIVYKFDAAKGTLTPNDPPATATAPVSGPRHFAFHPNGKLAFAINEIDLTLTAFAYDADKGVLKPLATVSTLPKGEMRNPSQSTAEVVVHPSGKFVYGSNRGHNTIAAFALDEKTGELTLIGHEGEGIKTPRNFNIDPTGHWLLVGNQSGDNVRVFHIDERTGKLSPTEVKVDIAAPVCLKFVPKGM